MSVNPCSVCGGKDLNLVDGYYYCAECGTQDVNVRETVVEQTMLADGTFAHVASRKIVTVLKDGIEMSPEWYKWHAYNFILCGLTDELLALGAAPSVKTQVLGIWMLYVKMFQEKEDLGKSHFQADEEETDKENHRIANSADDNSTTGSFRSSRSRIIFEEDLEEILDDLNQTMEKDAEFKSNTEVCKPKKISENENSILDDTLNQTMEKDAVDESDTEVRKSKRKSEKENSILDDTLNQTMEDISDNEEFQPKKKSKKEEFTHDINVITKGVLLAILYVALNLDQSEIQLSHLCRFIREGRLSITDCQKFLPKEIKVSSTAHWKSFIKCTKDYTPNHIRAIAMTLFKRLDLGKPLVPDVRNIVRNFVTELCLPRDFESLVFGLMICVPCDFAEAKIKIKRDRTETKRTPDYETVIMSYIVVALKMTFGLDDQYEIQLSDAVNKINQEKDYQKSHKLGRYSNETERLFSFKEWSNFLLFRKSILCKFYLPMAQQHNLEIDDHVFMEHLPERPKRKVDLRDEVTLDILNKIPLEDSVGVIPFTEFPPTLTPLSTYMEVILEYYQDPELKLLLSEDFTQYSLKYACIDLKLPNEDKMLTGVTKDHKKIVVDVNTELACRKADTTMVYVRNCENKNWLKTKPPKDEHVTKVTENVDLDKTSDQGYDSNSENVEKDSSVCNSLSGDTEIDKKIEYITEEDPNKNIFDDNFDDIETKSFNKSDAGALLYDESYKEFQNRSINLQNVDDKDTINDSKSDIHETVSEVSTYTSYKYDPATFNRDKTIKELILVACKKYKIPVPTEYSDKEPRKRQTPLTHAQAGCSESKRRKVITRPGQAKKEIESILASYYTNVQNDLFTQLSDHVKTVVLDLEKQDSHEPATDDCSNMQIKINTQQNFDDSVNMEQDIDNLENAKDPSEDCIVETDDSISIRDVQTSNPKFDEKTHDIKQLYIKFREELDIDNYSVDEDPEINEIITKKIMEFDASDIRNKQTVLDENESVEKKNSFKELQIQRLKKENEQKKWDFLVTDRERLKEFYYWRKHFGEMKRTLNVQQKFELEVRESLPKSFSFVIQECAFIANSSVFMIYKCMQALESLLL